MLKRIIS